jgi:hypothetical protein
MAMDNKRLGVAAAWMTLLSTACNDGDGHRGAGAAGGGAGDHVGSATSATTVSATGHGSSSVVSSSGSGGEVVSVFPMGLDVDATNVYWLDRGCMQGPTDGRVIRRPLAGGEAVVLSDGWNPGWDFGKIDVDGDYVYWAGALTVHRVPVNGGAAETLITVVSPHGVGAFAVDSTGIYWMHTNGETEELALERTVIDGGVTTTTLATVQGAGVASSVAVANGQVYWTNDADGTVMQVSIDGGPPVTLASAQSAGPIAVDDTSAYWGNQASAGAVMKLALAGGEPVELFGGVTARTLRIAGPDLVWSTHDGVMRGATAGGDRFTLAETSSVGIAVSATDVYWGVPGGSRQGPCIPAGAIESVPLDSGEVVEP